MDTGSENIILFPDYQELKEKVERMRTELSMLLLERDELEFVICKNIETAYFLKLGAIEYKAYEAECTARRLKRMVELVRAGGHGLLRQSGLLAQQTNILPDPLFYFCVHFAPPSARKMV